MVSDSNLLPFAQELQHLLDQSDTSVRRLARLSGIPRRTLENWLYGYVLRPRSVEYVLKIARALHLTAEDADRLLVASGHPPLAELKEQTDVISSGLLADWLRAPLGLRGQNRVALPAAHNLPAPTTPFLGRQSLCERLASMLCERDIRLVTISGLGGVGKTRLALETARQLVDRFDYGVYFIPLDNVRSEQGFWESIVDGLRIPNDRVSLPRRLVRDYLQEKQVLLLLDNFEHLLSLRPEIIRLIKSTQRLTLLVTSRQALDLQAEQLLPIGGLSFDEGIDSPAFQLYVDTVRRRLPDYDPPAEEASDIEALAEAVDGLPLALDLAAIWRDVLTPREVLVHIAGGLDQVHHRADDRPSRHHSLWVLFDYSWQMLSERAQLAALCLSILRGSFSSPMARALAGCHVATLKELIQSSFVGQTTTSRLALHPLVRQFLVQKAVRAGHDYDHLEDHFVQVVLAWTAEQSSLLRETFEAGYYQALHAEWRHIERAWWLAVDRQRYDLLEDCLDLLFYFEARGTYVQGNALFAETRRLLPVDNRRMQARLDEAQAFLYAWLLELPRAMKLARRALRTYQALGVDIETDVVGTYAQLVLTTAEYQLKQAAFTEAGKEELRRVTSGYLDKFTEIALALHDGVVACNNRDFHQATQAFRRALHVGGPDDYTTPILRCFLALGLKSIGEFEAAVEQNQLALHRARELDIYPAVVAATYELRLLQGDNPGIEACSAALEELALQIGSRSAVGRVATLAAVQYLNLGFTGQAQQLTRIGVAMLWGNLSASERARLLRVTAQTYLAFGLIRSASQIRSFLSLTKGSDA